MDCISEGTASELTIQYINEELEKLTERQRELSSRMRTNEKKQILLKKIIFRKVPFEEKKNIVKTYIKEIRIFDKGIEIIWNI